MVPHVGDRGPAGPGVALLCALVDQCGQPGGIQDGDGTEDECGIDDRPSAIGPGDGAGHHGECRSHAEEQAPVVGIEKKREEHCERRKVAAAAEDEGMQEGCDGE